MEIYVNGTQLDIYKGQDVELNWENIRFSDAIADEWSTDIEFPNNQHNIQVLEAYGLLDRGAIFNTPVPCSLVISDISYDSYLHVTEFTKDTITASVFRLTIPYAIYDKQISDYYPDDNETSIFRWDRYTQINTSNGTNDIDMYRYDYNSDYYSNISAQLHPSIRAKKILQNIENVENITLPVLNNNLFFTTTKQVVCPQNKFQCFMTRWKNNTPPSNPLKLVGGQHITNDFSCDWSYKNFKWNEYWTDWDIVETYMDQVTNASQDEIVFNRSCSCRIWVYGNTNRATWNAHVYKNNEDLTYNYIGGTDLYRIPNGSGDNPPTWSVNDCLAVYLPIVTFNKGDKLKFKMGVSFGSPLNTTANMSILIEYLSYSITDDDYDTQLNYYPVQFGLGYSWLNGIGTVSTDEFRYSTDGKGFGANGFLDHSMCYYGAWANMGSCSVREFISNMCWIHDKKLKLDKYTLSFTNPYSAKEITGNITKIATTSDKLGQRNEIKYADDNFPIWWNIYNDFLDDEVDLFESIFTTSKYMYGIATVEQYKFENQMTEPNSSGESWVEDIKVEMEDFDFLLFRLMPYNGGVRLEKAPVISDFGLKDIESTVSVDIETYDNCNEYDYVYLDGRKYLVVNGSINMENGLNELECIEIPTKYNGGCAAPTITFSFIPSVTDCIMQYNLYDNTDAGTYSMTVKQGSTVIGTYTLDIGVNQFQSISGLSADTEYTVEFSGSNSCGSISLTSSFRTYASLPPTVQITNIYNVNGEGATITFNITENQ